MCEQNTNEFWASEFILKEIKRKLNTNNETIAHEKITPRRLVALQLVHFLFLI